MTFSTAEVSENLKSLVRGTRISRTRDLRKVTPQAHVPFSKILGHSLTSPTFAAVRQPVIQWACTQQLNRSPMPSKMEVKAEVMWHIKSGISLRAMETPIIPLLRQHGFAERTTQSLHRGDHCSDSHSRTSALLGFLVLQRIAL